MVISIEMNKLYIYRKKLITPELCDFISNWLFEKTKNYPSDIQCNNSPAIHSKDDHVMNALLFYLKPKIEDATKLKLKPIYSYSRVYKEGADLKPHTDRGACEISCSITLNYNYKNKKYKWPLYMGNKPREIKKGDGVIYKGMLITHSRKKFTQKNPSWHHQIFLHYVNVNGPYSFLKMELT